MSKYEHTFGQIIEAPYPPMSSDQFKLDLKRKPLALFHKMSKEGDTRLGGFEGWSMYFPTSQYLPEEGTGAHIMLVPDFTMVARMSTELVSYSQHLGLLFDHLLPITKRDSRFVFGWNEARDRSRRTSQSWHTLHVHAVRLPEEEYINTLSHPIKALREPFYHHFERITSWILEDMHAPISRDRFAPSDSIEEPPFPKGGLVFPFKKEATSSAAFAALTFNIVRHYQIYHDLIGRAFITNYNEVQKTEGEVLPVLRPLSETEDIIKCDRYNSLQHDESGAYSYYHDIVLPSQEKEFLLRLIRKLAAHPTKNGPTVLGPESRFIPIPAYSFAVQQRQGTVQLIFSPQIASTRGVMEAIGIKPVRIEKPDASIEERKKRAKDLAEEIIHTYG